MMIKDVITMSGYTLNKIVRLLILLFVLLLYCRQFNNAVDPEYDKSIPVPPRGLSFKAATARSITLAFQHDYINTDGIIIYRNNKAHDTVFNGEIYVDTVDMAASSNYSYVLCAFNINGVSQFTYKIYAYTLTDFEQLKNLGGFIVVVTDYSGHSLTDVTLILNGMSSVVVKDTLKSDVLGRVVSKQKYVPGNYRVILSKKGYTAITDTFTLIKDTILDMDTLIITENPVADAGNDTILTGTNSILLTGRKSSVVGDSIIFEWDIGNTGTFIKVPTGDTTISFTNSGIMNVLKVNDRYGGVSLDIICVYKSVKFIENSGGSKGGYLRIFMGKLWSFAKFGQSIYLYDNGTWKLISSTPELPTRESYGCVVYNNIVWMLGGKRGAVEYNDVWYSSNCVDWYLMTDEASFTKTSEPKTFTFKSKMWLNHQKGLWSSSDGLNWTKMSDIPDYFSNIVVYDGMIWGTVDFDLSGNAVKNNLYGVWNSDDGITWNRLETANLYSPRRGGSVVVADNRLWMIGGNSLNDVWSSFDGAKWMKLRNNEIFNKVDYYECFEYENHLWVGSMYKYPLTD